MKIHPGRLTKLLPKVIHSESGYTLVEVLVAFFIFLGVAVPMIVGIFSNTASVRSQEMLTASWLLEQEAMQVRFFPDSLETTVDRKADGKAWQVKIAQSGGPLVQYHLTAVKNGRNAGELFFYAYKK
jgi:Tfp pilus assembly protein PilV